MRALYEIAGGLSQTAPIDIVRKFEQLQLLEAAGAKNIAMTWDQLRSMKAGDVNFLRHYLLATQPKIEEVS